MHRLSLTLGSFLLAAPLFLLCGAVLTPQQPLIWLLPLAAALLLAWGDRLLPAGKRVLGALTAMALSAGVALLIGRLLGIGLPALIPALLSAGAAAAQARLLSMPRAAVPPSLWYIGLAAYLAVRLIGRLHDLTALPGPLRSFALLYAVYLFFLLSGQSLRDGAGGGRAPSRSMRLRIAGAAALLSALLLALTHLPALRRLVRRAALGVVEAVLRLLDWLGSLFMRQNAGGGGGGGMDLSELAGEAQEPSALLVFLEKVAFVLAAIALAIAAALLIRAAVRALRRALRRLMKRLRAYAGALTDAYDDTVESLVDWGEVRRALQPRRGRARREKEAPWEALTPRQRVRRSYRNYLRSHSDIPLRSTARQQLSDPGLASLYEAARYSSREITPEEAEESKKMRDLR